MMLAREFRYAGDRRRYLVREWDPDLSNEWKYAPMDGRAQVSAGAGTNMIGWACS